MNEPLHMHTAFCCQIHGVRLALCASLVQRVTTGVCALPPSWAQPWIGGSCWLDDELLMVVDPSGVLAESRTPQRPLLLVVRPIARLPRWALAVEAAQENVLVERHLASFARPSAWLCPQEWLQTASDSSGRPLAWLDVARVAYALSTGYRTPVVT